MSAADFTQLVDSPLGLVDSQEYVLTPNDPVPTVASTSGSIGKCLARNLGVILLFLILGGSTGCAHNMHRRVTIRSEPPGALVLLEGQELGYTPVAFDFDHYGTREITLIKDGYETVTAMQKIKTPWYQRLPIDFLTDNFSPVKINDRHDYTFTLNKQEIVSNDQLLERAKDLRSKAQVLPQQIDP